MLSVPDLISYTHINIIHNAITKIIHNQINMWLHPNYSGRALCDYFKYSCCVNELFLLTIVIRQK